MIADDHLRLLCGDKDFQIALLRAQNDTLKEKIATLEKVPQPEKPPE